MVSFGRWIVHPELASAPRRRRKGPSPWAFVLLILAAACGGGGSRTGNNGDPGPVEFAVVNEAGEEREETISVSVPFARGTIRDLSNLSIKDLPTAWRVLQRWPDASVRIAQAQATDRIGPNETKKYSVVTASAALGGSFQQNPWVVSQYPEFRFFSVVWDNDSVPYSAELSGDGETLDETALIRTRRFRLYHRNPNGSIGIARDFLTSTMYFTEHRDTPIATIDVILGNDYLGADNPTGSDPNLYPLGSVAFKAVEVGFRGVQCEPAYKSQNWLGDPYNDGQGNKRYFVLGSDYMADGVTKRWRFVLYFEDPNASQVERDKWRAVQRAAASMPLRALADCKTWQKSGALGLHGGPVNGPADSKNLAASDLSSWRTNAAHFGPWGSWGDVKYSNTAGTPRNAPVSPELAHAVQAEYPLLIERLEGIAWQQACRAYHLYGLQVGAEENIYLWDGVPYTPNGRDLSGQKLGRFALYQSDPYVRWRNGVNWGDVWRGWTPFDHEHWTTDALFDYWSVTGDAWSREELRNLGQSLKGLMRIKTYYTATAQPARAEGWCMTGFVQCYLATGDESLKAYAIRRTKEVVDRDRKKSHPSKAMFFQDTPVWFPQPSRYVYSWQHAAIIYGYVAAHEFFGDELFLDIAEDVVTTLEWAWVTNVQHPKFGFVANGIRYAIPVEYKGAPVAVDHFDKDPAYGIMFGDSPLGGAHTFYISALFLLADATTDGGVRSRCRRFGGILLGPNYKSSPGWGWTKWESVIPLGQLP